MEQVIHTVSKYTDLCPTDTGGGIFKVYGPIGVGGTGLGVELCGPVFFHILSRTRIEGYWRKGILPRVFPNQAATATSNKYKNI